MNKAGRALAPQPDSLQIQTALHFRSEECPGDSDEQDRDWGQGAGWAVLERQGRSLPKDLACALRTR